MKRTFQLVAIVTLILSLTPLAFAQESGRSRAKRSAPAASSTKSPGGGVAAVIRTDGAMVYAKPDFDAEVLSSLNEGQRVRVSSQTTGDFAKFHKVRVGPILGYIAEIDVQLEGAAKKREHKRGDKKADAAKKKKKNDDRPKLPMMFTRYVGALIGQASYKESIQGVDGEDNILIYGLKVTGPDVVLEGPIMDLNVALHYGAPSYYDRISTNGKATGFVLIVDPLVLLPFINGDNHMFYLGVGPVLTYSSFRALTVNGPFDNSAFGIGASFSAGGGFRVDKVAVRLEGKYFLERQSYKGVQLSVQSQF